MTTYPFLSPEWIEAALEIRDEYASRVDEPPSEIRVNLVVTDVPFGDDRIEASIDTSTGSPIPVLGGITDPETTITFDYETARTLLIAQDPQAAGAAFMSGRIRVDGDLTKLFALRQLTPTPDALALAAEVNQRVLDITSDLD